MKDPVTTPCLLVLQIHTFKTTTFLKKHVPPSFVISVGGTIFIIESTDSCTLSGCDSVFYVNYQAQKHRTLYKHVQNGTIACRMVQSRAEWYNRLQKTLGMLVAWKPHTQTISCKQLKHSYNTARSGISGYYPDTPP